MKHILLGLLVFATACNKPSEDNCRKALQNMQHLLGTENLNPTGFEGEVRRCKGGSTRKAVDCAIKATTLEELRACDFYKVPNQPAGSAATGSAGSAATGSAATGSAASSATSGSAATGSATSGSAAIGSAATGSAAGSASTAAGSASGGATSTATGSGSAK